MKCRACGGTTKIRHNEEKSDGSIKRTRLCSSCKTAFVTYERPSVDTVKVYEQRLVNKFREMTKAQRASLWAHIRAMML